jgi:CBS domain-containing protein
MRILVEACVADGRVSDRGRLDHAIRESWPEDTLSIGPHAWLPHFRTDAVRGVVAALGIAREAGRYLQSVAAFARALSKPEVAAGLLAAGSAEDVLGLAALADIELQGNLLVRDIMTTPVVSVGPDVSLGEAAQLLMRHQVEAVPVVASSGEVLGLLSHRELLRHLVPDYVQRVTTGELPAVSGRSRPASPSGTPVREAMARNVLCVGEEQSVADVAHLLAAKDVGRVPVVKDGVLTGFLTRQDIVRKVIGR